MVESVLIQVMRDDRRSTTVSVPVSFWTSCAWSGSGRHRFEDGKSEWMTKRIGGPYRFCSLCGVIVPEEGMPKRKVNSNSIQRSRVWRDRVQFCLDRDGDGCFYCRIVLASIVNYRLDHFIPRSRGGSDALENRRVACVPCDTAKGGRMPDGFRQGRFPGPKGSVRVPS